MDRKLDEEIVRKFVARAKQERCLAFVSKSRTRDKFISMLASPAVFDKRCVEEISGVDRATPSNLIRKLTASGLGKQVYVVSESLAWDGQVFELSEIIPLCLAAGVDTLGYCPEAGAAFYEWHHSGSSYLLTSKFPR